MLAAERKYRLLYLSKDLHLPWSYPPYALFARFLPLVVSVLLCLPMRHFLLAVEAGPEYALQHDRRQRPPGHMRSAGSGLF